MKANAKTAIRSLMLLASLGAGVACGGTRDAVAASSTGVASAAMATSPAGPRGGGFRPLRMMEEALQEVNVRPEQKAEIEKLSKEAAARHESVRKAWATLRETTATMVEKGIIDEGTLKGPMDELKGALAAAEPQDKAALQKLHDVLDGPQRHQLVDKIEERLSAHRDHHGAKGRFRHGPDGPDAQGEPSGRGHFGKHPMFANWHHLREQLELTPPQEQKFREIMKAEMKQHHHDGKGPKGFHGHHGKGREALAKFREDSFRADEVLPSRSAWQGGGGPWGEAMVRVLSQVVPELTENQRKRLATLLRTMGPHELHAESEESAHP